jgi:hypothetical protein
MPLSTGKGMDYRQSPDCLATSAQNGGCGATQPVRVKPGRDSGYRGWFKNPSCAGEPDHDGSKFGVRPECAPAWK